MLDYLKAIHIIGIVFWIGGLLVLSKLLKSRSEFEYEKFTKMIKKIFFSFLLPGLIIVLITGIINLSETNYLYLKQGWFHGKSLLVVILVAFTGLLYAEIKKPQSSRMVLGVIHGVTALSLFLIPLFTYLKF